MAILVGALISAVVMGGTLLLLNAAYTTVTDDPAELPKVKAPAEELKGTEVGPDGKTYRVWWVTTPRPGVQPGKYLIDESGQARYLVDPGIGGRLTKTASGTPIQKFNPPQPRLFATLIEGIMTQKLPWGLVILGAVLAIVMQLAGVSALAFAVGVYLPLATTLPIFVGGVLRGLVDRARRFTPEEAETSPGTLMSTGLIAGGSLAGIIIALLVVFEDFGKKIDFSIQTPGGEPSYHIPAIGAFAVMAAILLAVGLVGKRPVAEHAREGRGGPDRRDHVIRPRRGSLRGTGRCTADRETSLRPTDDLLPGRLIMRRFLTVAAGLVLGLELLAASAAAQGGITRAVTAATGWPAGAATPPPPT